MPIADDFSSTEFHLVSIAAVFRDQVPLDLDEKFGIRKPDAVAGGGAEHAGVVRARVCFMRIPTDRSRGCSGRGLDGACRMPPTAPRGCRPVRNGRRSGGNVEPEAAGGIAVEQERGIDLEEVEVTAHLDGTVSRIGDDDRSLSRDLDSASKSGRRPVRSDDFAGDHRIGW